MSFQSWGQDLSNDTHYAKIGWVVWSQWPWKGRSTFGLSKASEIQDGGLTKKWRNKKVLVSYLFNPSMYEKDRTKTTDGHIHRQTHYPRIIGGDGKENFQMAISRERMVRF